MLGKQLREAFMDVMQVIHAKDGEAATKEYQGKLEALNERILNPQASLQDTEPKTLNHAKPRKK